MSSTIEQILSAIAPQFDVDPNRDTHIELAELRTSVKCFGEKYNYAVALRAAHTLTLSSLATASGGAAGGITSKRQGDTAISFGGSGSTGVSGDLGQTSYGTELQGLINGAIYKVKVVSVPQCEG